MNFSSWAIRKPIPSILLFTLITVAGLVSFRMLSTQNSPDVDFPVVSVTASLPGVTFTQMKTEVTRKIEDSIVSIDAIKYITSTINDGSPTTMVKFQLGKDVQEAVNDVRDAVNHIRAQLPSDVQEPVIPCVTFASMPVLTYAVESIGMDVEDLSWFVDNTANKRLLPVHGVTRVTRQGGVDRGVYVQPDSVRLQALNMSAADINAQVRSIQQEAPDGCDNIGGQEQAVRTLGTVKSVHELVQMDISLSDGRRIRLVDVADVRDTVAEPCQMALFDGKSVISFRVSHSHGTSEIPMAKGAREALAALQAERPDVHVTEVYNMVKSVSDAYTASMHVLYEGVILAVIVVWLFLCDWRATFVSVVALPLSIIPTFAAMQLLGFTFNGVMLLVLTLVVGTLVDDTIVEVENIVCHLRNGKKPLEAVMEAAQEIGLAAVTTPLTLVVVSLPTVFMGGISGKFFRQFGRTVSLAVLASLPVAWLLTPMMVAYMLKPQDGPNRNGWIMMRYLQAVRWRLEYPWKTGGMAVVFFVVPVAIIGLIPATFLPSEDWAQLRMTMESPPGSTIAQTCNNTERVRKTVMQHKEIRHVYTAIGSGMMAGVSGSSGGEVRTGILTISLTDRHDRHIKQQGVQRQLREVLEGVSGVRISFGATGSGEQLQAVLAGDDPTTLQQAARDVMRDLRITPGLGAVISSAGLLRSEIVIHPDFMHVAQRGVTAAVTGQVVRVATADDYDVNLPKLNLSEWQVYTRVESDPKACNQTDTIRQLRVPGRNCAVPLENIADIFIGSGPAQIDRYDRSRNVTISVELEGRVLDDTNMAVEALPSIKNSPPGVRRAASDDVEGMQKLFSNFLLAMFAGVLCVYAVLVLLFHDFTQPVTILAALPLSVGDAFGPLAPFGSSLSLPALTGLLMLMGIVTKNSILLVEYTIAARRDLDMSRTETIIDACHKRAHPIVMTMVVMITGMVPMALGLEGDTGFRVPMTVAVIGGLLMSTLLSLFVVPVVSEKVDDLKEQALRKFRGARHHGHHAEAASEQGLCQVQHQVVYQRTALWGLPMPDVVLFQIDGLVCTILLNRPERRNAVDGPTATALLDASERFEADSALRVAVLGGTGGHFCAGADLTVVGSSSRRNHLDPDGDMPGPMGPSRMALFKPLIVAVSGYAVASGLGLALLADPRVMECDVVFGVFRRRWGVPFTDGGMVRLPRIIGTDRILDMILTGRAVPTDKALAMGLANCVVGPGETLAAAQKLIRDIAAFSQQCMLADRASAYAQWDLPLTAALQQKGARGMLIVFVEGAKDAARSVSGAGWLGK